MVGRPMSLAMLGSTGLQPFSFLIADALVDWHLTAMFVGAGCLNVLHWPVLCGQSGGAGHRVGIFVQQKAVAKEGSMRPG